MSPKHEDKHQTLTNYQYVHHHFTIYLQGDRENKSDAILNHSDVICFVSQQEHHHKSITCNKGDTFQNNRPS